MDRNRLNGEFDKTIGRQLQEKWEAEPQFTDIKYKNYHLVIVRHHLGHLNGYVGIKRCHPYFGKQMHDKKIRQLEVHGGITFAGQIRGDGFKKGFWYLGFDTAHSFDYVPGLQNIFKEMEETNDPVLKDLSNMVKKMESVFNGFIKPTTKADYKDIQYVSSEVSNLYEQIALVTERNKSYQHNFSKEYRELGKQKKSMLKERFSM